MVKHDIETSLKDTVFDNPGLVGNSISYSKAIIFKNYIPICNLVLQFYVMLELVGDRCVILCHTVIRRMKNHKKVLSGIFMNVQTLVCIIAGALFPIGMKNISNQMLQILSRYV